MRRAVLFFESHSGYFDGAQQSLFLLISKLDERRFYPIFLGPAEGELPRRLRAARIETIILPPDRDIASYGGAILRASPWKKARLLIPYMKYALQVAQIFRDKRIDIVHCNSLRSLLMVAPAARMVRIPLIWHLRLNLEVSLWNRVARRLANRIIVVSDSLRRDFPAGAGSADKFVVVPNGVDPAAFAPGVDRLQVRDEIGINLEWSVVGMAGSITERKGQLLLLQAAAKVVKEFPRVKFVLIGRTNDAHDEEYAAKLRGFIADMGLTENVRFMGWRSEMPQVLSALDLFVLPSSNEGLPRSILEAMAAAVPVVATNVGGNAELVVPGRTGLLVQPRDPGALAAAIEKLLRAPDTAREMGRAGRLMVEQHFSLRAAALGVERVFDQLLPADDHYGMARPKEGGVAHKEVATDAVTWKSWREKLVLFDTFDRRNFAKEEREGTRLKQGFFAFVRPEGRVLDLGCGTGSNQRFLTNGQTYVGIDPLRLKVANQYGFPFLLGMAEYLPFRDNSFDSAVCIATLDHVADPAMVISESLRILRPGGVLGIMNKGDIRGGRVARYGVHLRLGLRKLRYRNLVGLKRGLLEAVSGAEDDIHMHHFDSESLSTLCESGFQDIDTQMVGNTLFLRAIKPTFSDRRL